MIAVLLFVLTPLTMLVREWHLGQIEDQVRIQQTNRAEDALVFAEAEFQELQDRLLSRARRIARESTVIQSIRERERSESNAVPEALIRFVEERELGQREGIEIYDLNPRVIAWKGVDMPMDDAPSSERFLADFQTAVATDGERRTALVAWWPVMDGAQTIGIVRAIEIVQRRVPVQNQFIGDYDIAAEWQRSLRLPVRLVLGSDDALVPLDARSRVLQGRDGRILGRIVVDPPTVDQIIRGTVIRYDHVAAFWSCLLLIWLTAGVWTWHQRGLALARATPERITALGRLTALSAWLWIMRLLLLELDIPARWQRGKAPLAPLFDPAHLASTFGEGIFRSTGELVLTSIFCLIIAALIIQFQLANRGYSAIELRRGHSAGGATRRIHLYLIGGVLLVFGLGFLLREITHHVILDSTLDYFSRATLIPSPLQLLVFCSLLLLALACILIVAATFWPAARTAVLMRVREGHMPNRILSGWVAGFFGFLLVLWILDAIAVELLVALLVLAASAGATALLASREGQIDLLYLRSILPALFLLTMIVYPLLYEGLTIQRRHQMLDAADSFAEGRDPRVMFALEQALRQASAQDEIAEWLESTSPPDRYRVDSLTAAIVQSSLLGSLGGYEVSLTLVDAQGRPQGRYLESDQNTGRSVLDEIDAIEFDILHQMYQESAATGAMVEQVTGRRDPGRLQYEGIRPVQPRVTEPPVGWVMARAEPRSILQDYTAPFPRVLLPASTYESIYAGMSIAEFRDGVIVRNVGREFGRYRLAEEVWQRLQVDRELWRSETMEGQAYTTFYRRQDRPGIGLGRETVSVTAVRMPAANVFDHLFYLLRVTVAGLLLGLPLYLGGLIYRRRVGWLPAPQVRFRDKVLNAFLTVGILAVTVVGFVGLQLVTGENERSIQTWLRQHLERVEETLVLQAGPDELPYRVLERMDVDSLASRVGLDLNIYHGPWLVDSSRPQLIRERLIENRLPIEAYLALFYEGFRFTNTQQSVGSFTYTAGFQAFPDEQGRPRYVVSVPTLPEQERIEEERARTVAYLFGALLLLILVVMMTASVLADALARPVARLREGLESVARGRFQQELPVDSRDEIGELVETFNDMQRQLAESRRKLATQERQLAWREMARQVAHEIKNPLTPMKLSVQHLRRAYDGQSGATADGRDSKFERLFDRITITLIEQIDALARIANEFHTFARLPSRVLEKEDLNVIAEEAIALMQEESTAEFIFEAFPEPLVVNADREELRRIFINLIKNASQAIQEGQRGQIEVRTSTMVDKGTSFAMAEVIDNGAGIPAELQARIFEPNFSTKTSGTGLGLAIVRKSIEEMQGEVDFETEPGRGTRFWLRLPLVQEDWSTTAS